MVDYKGQQLIETIYAVAVIGFGLLAWCVGWYQQSFLLTVHGWAVGLVLALIVSF